jgi:hypothetical protein
VCGAWGCRILCGRRRQAGWKLAPPGGDGDDLDFWEMNSMNCPRCKATLKTIDYEGIRIETCSKCEGEWLDADELKHITKAREVRFDENERRAIAAATGITGVELKDVDDDLRCPKCSGQTDPINYGGDTGIIIDRCTDCHGIWLDAGEIEKIQMLIEGWEDGLADDLAQYGPKLRDIAIRLDAEDDVRVSRFGFINVIINGILDLRPAGYHG